MKNLIQKAYRGQLGPYLLSLVLLLILAASLTSCTGSNTPYGASTRTVLYGAAPPPGERIAGPSAVPPGGTVDLDVDLTPGHGKRTFSWVPPKGATNFDFPGEQPRPGGPPFHFQNVDESNDVRMSYTMPEDAEEGDKRLLFVVKFGFVASETRTTSGSGKDGSGLSSHGADLRELRTFHSAQ